MLTLILAAEGEFLVEAIFPPNCRQYNCNQDTSHRQLNKIGAQIRLARKKESDHAIARQTSRLPNEFLSRHILHIMTAK